MTSIMTEENVITLGAATEAILQHLYEEAVEKHDYKGSFESWLDHVLMRGKAEIDRTWKSQEKTAERNEQAKIVAENLKFIRVKQSRNQELTEAEQNFLNLFTKK